MNFNFEPPRLYYTVTDTFLATDYYKFNIIIFYFSVTYIYIVLELIVTVTDDRAI